MQHTDYDQLVRILRSQHACIGELLRHMDDLHAFVVRVKPARHDAASSSDDKARVDRGSFSVLWDGRSCHLGYTLAFRIMEHLSRSQGQYVPVDALLMAIWSGRRSRSAVRSAVDDLRRRLHDGGMPELASRIDGRNRGHYGLMPARS